MAATPSTATVVRLEGMMSPKSLLRYARAALRSPESTLADLRRTRRGFRFTLDAMWDEVSKLNLIELAPALETPAFFFLARRDRWVPPELSMAYVDALEAPSKQVVWFEKSGHEMFVDEPEKFNRELMERVRPAVLAAD